MRLVWRRLTEHETDHELLWLIVSIGSLGAASIWFALRLPWPICVFHGLIGLPCLTCGATRCTVALVHGNLVTAWFWNPFVFLVLCSVAFFDFYALAVLVTRSPRVRFVFSPRAKTFVRFALVGALVLNWIYLLSNYKMFSA